MKDKIPLRPWKTLERRLVYDHNRFLRVENHVVELPDGTIIDDWAWVEIPNAVIVLARTKAGQFVCFRQTKYAIPGTTCALASGMIEPGEEPLAAAKRELLEETGYSSNCWIQFGGYVLEPNRGCNTTHLFLALDAELTASVIKDDLEDQELLLLDQPELQLALQNGEFKALIWTATIALSLNYLQSITRSGEN